jgi:hypothetical protein
MNKIKVSREIKLDRRGSVRNCAMAVATAVTIIAVATLGMSGLAEAQFSKQNVSVSDTSFGPIKQIDKGLLNVGYVEAGPANGTPVILLHG